MTFATLRALLKIIDEALDEIESIYALHRCNSTQAKNKANHSSDVHFPDFPSLDAPYDPSSLSESLAQRPEVVVAINHIVAACGQMVATVQRPFLTLCDATMGNHLPSCMRVFEATHIPEILREAGPPGLHVEKISAKVGVEKNKLAHILRLLATHHIVREISPDAFSLNRISSTIDTGKRFQDIQKWEAEGIPEKKYEGTSGTAAFVGLCTDEINKSSAYLTEAYLLSPSQTIRQGSDPRCAPFSFAFGTLESRTAYFAWLEGVGSAKAPKQAYCNEQFSTPQSYTSINNSNSNRFRLERFGKAMAGTGNWETPGAILNAFDWHSLPRNSIIVDVGGGIGSASMLLADAFAASEDGPGLRFIVQDRPEVAELGEKAWRAKRSKFLKNGTVLFQGHDFFMPQPVKQATVFLVRAVLHDWPDDFARHILLHLREAAKSDTKLLIGDFILPLACADDTEINDVLQGTQGVESSSAPAPLLPNLGKASAVAYWMDMAMQVMFNSQERTLREIIALAASTGWKVVKVTKCIDSLFGYTVAVPVDIPPATFSKGDNSIVDSASTAAAIENINTISVHHGLNVKYGHREHNALEHASSGRNKFKFGLQNQLPHFAAVISRFERVLHFRDSTTTNKPSVPLVEPIVKQSSFPLSMPLSVPPDMIDSSSFPTKTMEQPAHYKAMERVMTMKQHNLSHLTPHNDDPSASTTSSRLPSPFVGQRGQARWYARNHEETRSRTQSTDRQ